MGLFSGKADDYVVTQLASCQAEILAYIHSLLPGDASVNDILQRTNLVIWKKRQHFELGTNFRAWAFSIARWEVRAFLKERKRKSWLIIDEELAEKVTQTMEHVSQDNPMTDLREALDACLHKLNEGERELLTHRYHSDAPLKVFAEAHGRPVTSLKTSLCRIRASLKRCIEAAQKRAGIQSI
ncbi:sigma-70 family RNA polymerase sigma factor [Verrucomicrobiaceae bacterium N1E253]|uniref:Sigma-70 family RNA polymerase sigma factor n=1 Tax=Oceaniferula marina TaxID=2748318 RepID=A0A851GQM2_9BACT|nr:sigma-70 family RNA polymerase sigma factor [Oceaniferula marina]NWK57405.1 sigma-70 family RNA polymerase sigma factor [Oceaniferula marina]